MRPRRSAVYHEVPDVSEMDPWKDDRCRDFVALNTIQRLRAYHLAPGLPMPPIEPVHAVRAKNLLLLPRATPDYRPCMGELPSATPRLSFSSSNEETPPPRPSSSTIKKEKEVSERTRRMENARKAQGKWKEREKTEESTKAEEEEELKEGQKETQEEHTEDGPKDPTPLGKHFSTPFLLAALPSSFHASTPSNDRPPACDGGGGHDAAGAASSLSSSSSTPRPPRSWSGPSIHTHSTTECALHLARQVFFGLNAFPPSSSPSSTPVSRPTGTMMSDGAPKSLPLPSPSSSPFIVYPTHLHSPPPPISTPFPGSSDKVERSGGGKVDPHADACSACGERGEHSHSSGVCPSPLSSSPPPLLVQKEINKEAIKEEVKKSELEGAISPSSSNTPLRGGGMAPLSTSPRMVVDNDGLLHSTPLRVSPLDALSTDLSPSIHLPVSSFAISSGDRLPCLDAVAGPSFPFPDPEEKSELGEEVGKEKLGRSAALFFPPSSTTQEAKVEKGRHPTSWVTPSVNRGREDQGQQEDNGDSLYTSHRDGPFHMMTLPYCGLSSSGEEVESNVERCSPLPLSFCPCSASPSASSAIIPKSEGEGGNMTKDVSIRTACGAYLDGKEENELRYTPSLPATALHSSSATSYPLSPAPRPSLLVLSDLQKEDSIDKALAQGRRGRGGISGKDSGGHGGTPPTPLCIPPLPRFSGEVDINLPSLPLPNAEEERKVEGEGEPLASSSSAQVSMENTPLPHRPPSALPAAVAATTTASTSTGVMMVSSECSCDAVVHSLVAYYQSLLTRGVVLDRFNHKELAFAWWVIGRNMDRQALETPGTARREALLITLRDFYYSQLSSKRRSSSALVGGGSGVEEQLQAATRENESHLPSPPTSSSAARAESFIRKISTEALPGSGNEGKGGGGRRREKDTTLSSTPSLVPARGSSDTSPSLEHYSGSSSKKEDERLSHASLFPIRIHGGRERGKGKEGTGKRVKKSTRVKGKAGAATWEMMESEMEEEEEVEEDGTLPQQEESPASKLRSSRGRGRRRQREEEQDHKEGREGEEKEEEEAEGGGGEKKRKKNKDLESEEDREVGEKEEEELQDGGPHSSSLPASTTTRTNTKKKSRKSEEVQRQHQQGEEKVEMSGKKKGRLRRPREEEDEEEEEKKEKKGKGDVAQQEREVNASTCSPSPSSSSRRKKRMTQEEKRKAIEELWLPSSSRSNRSARTQERLQALEALLRDKTEEQHSSSAALPSSSLVLGSSHLPPSLPVQDGGGRRAGTGFVTSSSSTSSSCSAPSFHHDPEKIKKSPKKQRDIETPLHPSSTTTSSSRSVVVGGDGKEIDRRAGQQKMEPDENEKEGERGRGEISSQSDASSSNMKEKKENKTIEEPHHTSISKKKIHPHGEDKKKKKEEGVEVVGVEEEKNDKVTLKKGREGIESFASTSLATAVAGDRGEGGQRGECQSGGGVLLSSLATALPTNNLTRDTQASKGEEWKKTRKGRKRTHSDVLISSLPPCESSTSHLSAVEEAFCILSSSVLGSPSPSPASESFPLNHFQQRIQERLRFRLLGGGGGIRTTSCSSSPCRCRRCCPPPTSPSPCEKDSAAFSPTPAVPRPAPARVVAASLPTPPSPLSLEDYLTKGGYPSHLVSSYRYLLLSSHHLTDRDVGDREWSGFPSEAWAVGGGAGLHLDTSSSTGRGMKKNSHSSRNHTKKEDEEEEDVDGAEMSHVKRRKCQPLQLTAVTSTSNNCNSIREGKEDPIPAYYRSHVPPLRSIQVDMEAEYGGVDPVLLTNSFYRHNQKDWESYMHRTLCEALEGKKVQEKNDHVKEKVVEKGSSGVQPVGHLPSEKGSTARMPEDERGKNGWLLLVPSDNSPPLTNHLSHAPSPPASTDKAIPCESSFELKKVEQHQLGCSSDDNGTDEEKTRIAFDNAAETLIHDLTDDEGKKEMRNEKKGNVAAPPSTEAAPTSSNRTTSLPCDIHSLPYAQQCLLVWEAACLLDPPSKPRSSAPHGGEQQESSAISDNGGHENVGKTTFFEQIRYMYDPVLQKEASAALRQASPTVQESQKKGMVESAATLQSPSGNIHGDGEKVPLGASSSHSNYSNSFTGFSSSPEHGGISSAKELERELLVPCAKSNGSEYIIPASKELLDSRHISPTVGLNYAKVAHREAAAVAALHASVLFPATPLHQPPVVPTLPPPPSHAVAPHRDLASVPPKLKPCTLTLWDVSGQRTLRGLWSNYFHACQGLIFLVDTTLHLRLNPPFFMITKDHIAPLRALYNDYHQTLRHLLSLRELQGVPFLILGNKCDVPGHLTAAELQDALGLDEIALDAMFYKCIGEGDSSSASPHPDGSKGRSNAYGKGEPSSTEKKTIVDGKSISQEASHWGVAPSGVSFTPGTSTSAATHPQEKKPVSGNRSRRSSRRNSNRRNNVNNNGRRESIKKKDKHADPCASVSTLSSVPHSKATPADASGSSNVPSSLLVKEGEEKSNRNSTTTFSTSGNRSCYITSSSSSASPAVMQRRQSREGFGNKTLKLMCISALTGMSVAFAMDWMVQQLQDDARPLPS